MATPKEQLRALSPPGETRRSFLTRLAAAAALASPLLSPRRLAAEGESPATRPSRSSGATGTHTLTVVFSGVVAVVGQEMPGRYRVVLPATLPSLTTRLALDGEILRPHFPHLRIGRQVDFLEPGRSVDLDVSGLPSGADARLDGILRMDYALDRRLCRISKSVAMPTSPADASSYVDITCGTLEAGPVTNWRIDGSPLGGPDASHAVTGNVRWTIPGLTSDMPVASTPFGGGRRQLIATLPTGSGDVEIHIQNFLAEDVVAQIYQPNAHHMPVDEDFRWYYELLDDTAGSEDSPKEWVRKALKRNGGKLPLPTRAVSADDGEFGDLRRESGSALHGPAVDPLVAAIRRRGWTHNCMPMLFPWWP